MWVSAALFQAAAGGHCSLDRDLFSVWLIKLCFSVRMHEDRSGDCGSFCCRKYTWRILFVRKPINTDVACGKYTRSTFSSVDRSPPALFIPAASRGLTQTQKLHSSPVGRPQSCKLNTSTTFPYVQMVQNNTLKL